MKQNNKYGKNELRKYFLERRKNISDNEKKKQSQFLREKAIEYILKKKIKKKKYIALFAGTEYEPNLVPIITDRGTSEISFVFCFPRITNFKEGKMDFFQVQSATDLEKNSFGILEPKKKCKKISSDEIAIFFIPAVSIDNNGNRIGMGGGFYDRYLQRKNNIKKIGVIFNEQKSQKLFTIDIWDVAVDCVL